MTAPLRPRYAPYAGRHPPFSIAMAPLEPENWLEFDAGLADELQQKRVIFGSEPDAFMAEPGTEAAQQEAAALVGAFVRGKGAQFIMPPGAPPLLAAALNVHDDLVLMRRNQDGTWRLAAAALAFPSHWSLAEKFERPMDAIHAGVPGWAGSMGARVQRIFDGLTPEKLVWRLNWAIQFGGGLRQSKSKDDLSPPPDPSAAILVRVERQTLRKLPVSGDILFTIKVMLDPIAALSRHPDGPRLAAALAQRLADLDPAQLAYKSLALERDRVIAALAAYRSAQGL